MSMHVSIAVGEKERRTNSHQVTDVKVTCVDDSHVDSFFSSSVIVWLGEQCLLKGNTCSIWSFIDGTKQSETTVFT